MNWLFEIMPGNASSKLSIMSRVVVNIWNLVHCDVLFDVSGDISTVWSHASRVRYDIAISCSTIQNCFEPFAGYRVKQPRLSQGENGASVERADLASIKERY